MNSLSQSFISTYSFIIPIYCTCSLLCALFNFNLIEVLWVAFLDKFFSLTASYFAPEVATIQENSKNENNKKQGDFKPSESSSSLLAYEQDLIERDVHLTENGVVARSGFFHDANSDFQLHHPIYLVKSGIEAIIEDDVTKRFTAGELRVWNFLSRNQGYQYIGKEYSWGLNILWFFGFFIRYIILFPCRIVTFFIALFLTWSTGLMLACISNPRFKAIARKYIYTGVMRMNLRPYSSVVRFHNTYNLPMPNSIVVANHTTPIDYVVLCSDIAYSAIGQIHQGFFGMVERMLSMAIPTVWFDRSELLDRNLTAQKLKLHVASPGSPPLLVFPEGTCINNTSVMKFKKGCFEIDTEVYPLTIKYDPRFADCFWNSSVDSFFQYLIKLMTSWALVVDVWYLSPQRIREGEDGISFARRVRQMIAECGGLVDMEWDGELKRKRPKEEFMVSQQKLYTRYLKTQ